MDKNNADKIIPEWAIRFKRLREDKRQTQFDLEASSDIDRATISSWELGYVKKIPNEQDIQKLAHGLEVNPDWLRSYLFGQNPSVIPSKSSDHDLIFEIDKRIKVLPIPIRGYINAGTPAPAEAVDLGVAWVEKDKISGVKKVESVFGLKVNGDSLIGDKINSGDVVVVEPNADMIDGKIYIVKLDNEFVARHVHREDGFAILTSSNGKYSRIEVEKLEIIGRVILAVNPEYRTF